MSKRIRFTSLLLAIVMVLSMTLLAGCGKKSSEDVVVTINDENISLSEAMYYIYMVEANFGMMLSSEYWDTVVEEDRTFSDLTKEYVMDGLVEMHILSKEVSKDEVKLTADIETQLKTSAVEFYNSMSDQLKEITGLNEQSIYEISVKNYLASLQQNNILSTVEIDIEEIESGYNREEYRQYNTQYLLIPFVSTDAENKEVKLTDAEKAEAKTTMESALADINSGKTFDEVVEKYEDVTASSANFLPGENNSVSADYQTVAMELENDEIADNIVETSDGYYIIKMVNNDSDAYYMSVINDAAGQKQQEIYQEKFDEIKEGYTITINEEVWEPIKVGRTTINLEANEVATDESVDSDETIKEKENPDNSGDSDDTDDSEATTE